MEPIELPSRKADEGDKGASQLSILLSSATSMVDEEFKRSERLDAKSRNQITIAGSFFAIVQAVVVGLINGSLGATETTGRSSFVGWLAAAGAAAGIALVVALAFSYRAWKLREDDALEPDTLTDYISYAQKGNEAVAVKLVTAYAEIAKQRRDNNETRAKAMEHAARACFIALAFVSVELTLAFIAVIVQ
jgi:hypothetical protein